jgi:hypothetical protein
MQTFQSDCPKTAGSPLSEAASRKKESPVKESRRLSPSAKPGRGKWVRIWPPNS